VTDRASRRLLSVCCGDADAGQSGIAQAPA
jgi:hypothetical protein